MSDIPSDLRYTRSHEWLRLEGDGTATLGITAYAQDSLGDITFVQLPKVGASLAPQAAFGVVESVKAASDLYAPVAGTVAAVNEALGSHPEKINQAPYGEGWILKLKLSQPKDAAALLDAEGYRKLVGE